MRYIEVLIGSMFAILMQLIGLVASLGAMIVGMGALGVAILLPAVCCGLPVLILLLL